MAFAAGAPLDAFAQETGASSFTQIWTVPAEAEVNAEACADNDSITVGWTLDAAPAGDQSIRVTTSTAEDCGSVIEQIVERPALLSEDTQAVGAATILPDCPDVDGESRFICVRLFPATGAENGIASAVAVWVDTVAPEPPDELSAREADQAVRVDWSWSDGAPEDLASVIAYYRPSGSDADPGERSAAGTSSSVRIEGLDNETVYEVWLRAVDDVGNVGEESEVILATPQDTTGFWDLYRESGGSETGGCSGANGPAGAALILVAMLAGLMVFRRRRTDVSGATLVALALTAFATAWPSVSEARVRSDSVGSWFIDVDLGPYLPEVDSEFGGDGPYREVFGGKQRLMMRVRADRAIWQGVGQLSVGFSAGYARASAEALFADGTRSADTTAFGWVPLAASLVYRFDHTVRAWGVPLVPYGRAGLSLTPWWISGPDGIAVDGDGNSAMGARAGWFYGGGLKFLLNFIDPKLSTDLRRSTGVERTYLYVDVTRMQVTGFGTAGFDLSDTTWFVGLSFEI